MIAGSLVIQNVTDDPYPVEELMGYVLAPGAQVDLLSTELDFFYRDWVAAYRLVTSCRTAKLYQDIQAGKIKVLVNRPIQITPIKKP